MAPLMAASAIPVLQALDLEAELGCGGGGRGEAEVPVAALREHAPARRALDEPLLDEIGLDHLLEHVALIAEGRGKRLDPRRPAAVVVREAAHIAPVHGVETGAVDLEP